MTNTRDTLVQDARDLLQYETTDLVSKQLQHLGWAQLDQQTRTLTIGRNTEEQTIISASPNGLAVASPQTLELSLLITRSSKKTAPFWKARQAIWNTIEKLCWQHLNITLRNGQPLFAEIAPNREETRKQRKIEKAVNTAVRNILARIGQGYVNDPERLGRHLIRSLLGTERVSRTLRIAGYQATLQHHNRIIQDLQAITLAHQQDPNATIIHFAQDPAAWDRTLTEEQILQSARNSFTRDCREYAPGQDQDELWNAFQGINPHAFRKCPPHDGAHIIILTAAQQSSNTPTCSTIAALLRERTALDRLPQEAVATFIQESSRRSSQRRTGTQAQMAQDLRTVSTEIAIHRDDFRQPDIIPPIQKVCRTPRSWKDIMDAVHQTSPRGEWSTKPRSRTGSSKTGSSKTGSTKKRPTQAETIRTILHSPEDGGQSAGSRIIHQLQERITLNHQPGAQALIQDNRTGAVLTGLTRAPNGALTIRGSLRQHPDPIIPNPLHDLPTDLAWSCRGELNRLTVQEARETVAQHPLWKEANFVKPPSTGHLKTAILEMGGGHSPEQLLSARYLQTVRQLIDPGTWTMTQELFPNITIRHYNSVQASREPIKELLTHNPGVIAWAAHHYMTRIEHPGQIITLVRSHLEIGGIQGQAWKHAARLNARTMRAICETRNTTRLLQAISAAQSQPIPECIPIINRIILEDYGWQHTESRLLNPLIQLACRQAQEVNPNHQSVQEFQEQLTSIRDYCHHLAQTAQDRQPLQTRSWKRALRLAHQWHTQTTQEARLRQWHTIMRNRETGPLQWESRLTGPVQIGGLTFTPLCSEEDLLGESIRMEHCVIHYGEQCNSGRSRIFSVQKDQKPLATLEINPGPGGAWQTAQLRGPHNHPVSSEVQAAALQLAKIYSNAQPNAQPQ